MYQPSGPWLRPAAAARQAAGHSLAGSPVSQANQASGSAKARPISRPISRWSPFPEEDELELGEIHSRRAVDLPIFRGLLVEVERAAASAVRSRGGMAPLTGRHSVMLKAAFGQPGDPADDDHREDQAGDAQQPVGDRVSGRESGPVDGREAGEGGQVERDSMSRRDMAGSHGLPTISKPSSM